MQTYVKTEPSDISWKRTLQPLDVHLLGYEASHRPLDQDRLYTPPSHYLLEDPNLGLQGTSAFSSPLPPHVWKVEWRRAKIQSSFFPKDGDHRRKREDMGPVLSANSDDLYKFRDDSCLMGVSFSTLKIGILA